MNIRALNLTSATAALLLAASRAGCGAAHVPSAGQGEVTDRFVANASVVAAPAALDEILVQATRLPAEPVAVLDEIVVTATRIADGASATTHNLDEIVVSATRLPNPLEVGGSDGQVAALLD